VKTNNYVGNIKLEKIKSGLKKLIRGGQNNNARSKFNSKFSRYYLGKLNLGVETVIDIGVYNGTPGGQNVFIERLKSYRRYCDMAIRALLSIYRTE
jgi:hypothetical protein